jgi:hypothetical protein
VIDSISSACLLFKKKHENVQRMVVVYYQQQEVPDNNHPATDRDWTIFDHHNKDGPVSSTARKVLQGEVYLKACKQMSKQEQHAL